MTLATVALQCLQSLSQLGPLALSPSRLRQLGLQARLGTCQRLRANDVDDVAMSLVKICLGIPGGKGT